MRRTNGRYAIIMLILVLAALIGPLLAMSLVGGFGPVGMMGGGPALGMMGGRGWLAMLLGLLSMLAFIGAIVVGATWLVRALGSDAGRERAAETAHDILRRRLAAGEISREEFERMKQILER